MSLFGRSGTDCSFSGALSEDSALTTPFEQWCEQSGLHPESPFAWERFEASRAPSAPSGAA